MANINKLFTLAWQGSYQDSCGDVPLNSFNGKIKNTFSVRYAGDTFNSVRPSSVNNFSPYTNFECGGTYYIQLEAGQSAAVQNAVIGTTGIDAGTITTLYPISFVMDPDGMADVYHMTTEFYGPTKDTRTP